MQNGFVLRGLPGELASQLERSAVSVVANICEGTGRVGMADRRQRFAIARGEANEAAGLVEIVRMHELFSNEDYSFCGARICASRSC